MNLMKWMNWMNNYCIKTYSLSNSSISSSERSSSSLVRSWIFSLDDPSFKSFSKSGFNMCSNMSLSPSNARRCLPHSRVAKIEDPVEHVKSTTRPFVGVNNSIKSWKKRGDFWYGPLVRPKLPPFSVVVLVRAYGSHSLTTVHWTLDMCGVPPNVTQNRHFHYIAQSTSIEKCSS